MIEERRRDHEWAVNCDDCGQVEVLSMDACAQWAGVIQWMKRNDWKISKQRDEWHHSCPECK